MLYYDKNGNEHRGRVVKGVALPREPRGETLVRLGLYHYTGRDAVPAGQRATGWHIEYDDETMTCRRVPDALEAIPPNPAIAKAAKAIRDLFAKLGISPVPPDWETAYKALEQLPHDDERLVAVMAILARRTELIEAGGRWGDVVNG